MKKFLQSILVIVCVLALASCASKRHAGVSDEGGLDGGVQTHGISENGLKGNNVGVDSKRDSGPTEGLLGKRSFYFEFNKDSVNQEDYEALKSHANYLIAHNSAKILVEGNTDPRGSREYNVALGQRRAEAIANILKSDGASSNQIRTLSYGAERLVATEHTEEAYQVDRRADVVYEENK